MKLAPPSVARQALITFGLVLALTAALGGTAAAATPTVAGVAPGSVTSPLPSRAEPTWDNDRDRDRDRHQSRDRDRDGRHHGPRHDRWRWKRWAVSPWQCRKGHGHVDWRHGRCWGGRFSGAWIRFR